MTTQQEQLNSYIASFTPPLEVYFFSPKEQEKIEAMRRKLDMTAQYLQAILDNPDLAKNLDRDTMSGKLYSIGEIANVNMMLSALEGDGARIDIKKSLVSPTGQVVILSENCASILGLMADGYIEKPDFEQFVQILRNEGVPDVQIKKLQEAISQNEVIMVQRGMFAALKPFMEEFAVVTSIKSSFEQYKKGVETKPVTPPAPNHGASLNALKDRLVNPAPPVAPKSSGPPMTPAEIKRELNTKEITNKASAVKSTPPPPPPAPPVQPKFTPPPKPAAAMKLVSTPSLGLPSLRDIKVVDDLKKVEPAHLRQGYLPEQAKLIRAKIAYLAGVNKVLPINVVNVFEQSPLFKLYLKVGNAILAQSTSEIKPDYKQVIAGMINKGEDVLSLAEFEVIADLRKDLEQM
jgi:hypothetical protein